MKIQLCPVPNIFFDLSMRWDFADKVERNKEKMPGKEAARRAKSEIYSLYLEERRKCKSQTCTTCGHCVTHCLGHVNMRDKYIIPSVPQQVSE